MVNVGMFAQIIFNGTTIITNRRSFDYLLKSVTQLLKSVQYLQLLSPANFNLLK